MIIYKIIKVIDFIAYWENLYNYKNRSSYYIEDIYGSINTIVNKYDLDNIEKKLIILNKKNKYLDTEDKKEIFYFYKKIFLDLFNDLNNTEKSKLIYNFYKEDSDKNYFELNNDLNNKYITIFNKLKSLEKVSTYLKKEDIIKIIKKEIKK